MLAWLATLAVLFSAPAAASTRPDVARAPGPAPVAQDGSRPGQPILIRWSTETETNTAGFNVYRAPSEDGPWEKINPRLIPSSLDPVRGGSYVFTDTNVIAGATYWYELEEVELGGRAIRLERTQATAKAQASNPLADLQCAGGLAMVMTFSLGTVVVARRRRWHAVS